MPSLDAILGPQLLAFVAPAALGLAAWALSSGERRAEARKIREDLHDNWSGAAPQSPSAAEGSREATGAARSPRPFDRVDASLEGKTVLLCGTIVLAAPECARFEDGAPAAVSTAELADPTVSNVVAPKLVRVANVRAESLVLKIAEELVAIDGPVRVILGSAETIVGDQAVLSPAATKRLSEAGAPASCTGFRSLRAGDRVRVLGKLVAHTEATRTGYRERGARFALVPPDDGHVIPMAFEATPRRIGPIGASARGLRDRRPLLITIAALVPIVAAIVATAAGVSRQDPPRRSPIAAAAAAPAPTSLGDPETCAGLSKRYTDAVSRAGVCATDDECLTERRGGPFSELEGCYRFLGKRASRSDIDVAERDWLAAGCGTSYDTCLAPPAAMCRQGHCAERPPEGVPSDWLRVEVGHALWFYAPESLQGREEAAADGLTAAFRGQGYVLELHEMSDVVPSEGEPFAGADSEDEAEATAMRVTIGGRQATLWLHGRRIGALFAGLPDCAPPACEGRTEHAVFVVARCESESACAEADKVLRAIRFR